MNTLNDLEQNENNEIPRRHKLFHLLSICVVITPSCVRGYFFVGVFFFFLDIEFMSCCDVVLCSWRSINCACVFQRAEKRAKKGKSKSLKPMNVGLVKFVCLFVFLNCNLFEGEAD